MLLSTSVLARGTAWAGAALLALGAQMATAQTAAPADEESGDIVVTALKRDTKLQDTPISITAMSSDALAKLGATSFIDYYRQVPSLQITEMSVGNRRVSLRGIFASGEPTVGLYYDETPLSGPSGTSSDPGVQTPDVNLFDVERVEVLRGPQGTLYGSGSVGGTIRVIFKKPDATKFEGAAEAQVTTTEDGSIGYFGKVAINAPIVADKLAVRAVLYKERRGGYVDNPALGVKDGNEADMYGGRLLVRFTPTEDFTLTGTALYQNNKVDGTTAWYRIYGASSFNTMAPLITPFKDELQMYNLTAEYDAGPATITLTASDYNWDIVRFVDVTGNLDRVQANPTAAAGSCRIYFGLGTTACSTAQLASYNAYTLGTLPAALLGDLKLRSRNYEARVTSKPGGPLDWTAGVYHEDRRDYARSALVSANPTTGVIGTPYTVNGDRYVGNNIKQTAFFGEVSYKPVEPLTLTAGARHYSYKKLTYGQVVQTGYLLSSFVGARAQANADAKGWVLKGNASFKVTSDVLIYAQAAQGFRPGGANNVPGLAQTLIGYDPDKIWTYESGIKSSLAGGKLLLNGAVYQTDWNDMQAQVRAPTVTGQYLANVGKSRIRGGELEAVIKPMRGLSLTLAGNYTDAKLIAPQTNANLTPTAQTGQKGDRIPYISKFTGSASVEYSWSFGEGFGAFVRGDYSYRSSSANDFRPTYVFYEKLDGYALVNGRVGLNKGPWTASLFVNNVFNKIGEVAASSSQGTARYPLERAVITTIPRTVGLNVGVEF